MITDHRYFGKERNKGISYRGYRSLLIYSFVKQCTLICDIFRKCALPLLLIFIILFFLSLSLERQYPPKSFPDNSKSQSPSILLHFVWIENRQSDFAYDLTVLQYLSILSALRRAPSATIWFHTNGQFAGPFWKAIRQNISLVPIRRYTDVGGKPVKVIEEEADLLKLDVGIQYGGIFVDFDVFFTGSIQRILDKLKTHECIFRAIPFKQRILFQMGNFACNPNSSFLREIYRDYNENYRGSCYRLLSSMYNGCLYAYLLYNQTEKFQNSIYVDRGELLMHYLKNDGVVFRLGPRRLPWTSYINIHTGDEGSELCYMDVWKRNSSFGDMLREVITTTSNPANMQISESVCQSVLKSTSGLVLNYVLTSSSLNLKEKNIRLPDLTNLEYLSILSAIKFVEPRLIIIHVDPGTVLTGPRIRDLQNRKKNTIFSCWKSNFVANESKSQSLLMDGNTFFVKNATLIFHNGTVFRLGMQFHFKSSRYLLASDFHPSLSSRSKEKS
jgi:hypothetical protein